MIIGTPQNVPPGSSGGQGHPGPGNQGNPNTVKQKKFSLNDS
jgi:hypothetical protein